MPLQYKRKYELIIGADSGIKLSDLRVKFEVTKDLTGYPNLAKIQIFNLSKSTQQRIKKEFDKVIFNAGYESNVRLLFKGQIRNVTHLKQGVDTITTIFAHDGAKDFDTAKVNISFKEGTKVKQIVEHVIGTFKETTHGIIEGLDGLGDRLQGVTLSGSSKDVMDQLAEENNFEWNITDEAINVIPKNETIDKTFLITSATGMLGSPTLTEIGADVTMLLNPELIPNGKLKVESITQNISLGDLQFRDINKTIGEGLYKIQKITHTGDTHDNQCDSSVVVVYI
mgnify:CR=1 FL=1